jgi:ClpP class serine protease
MKAPLHRIAARLYAEPWLLRADKYQSLCQQFRVISQSREDKLVTWYEPNNDPFQEARQVTSGNCLDRCEIARGVAILRVQGILGGHLNRMEAGCGGYDINVLRQQALALQSRPDVHTVIMHWISPGGAASGIADTAQVLMDLGTTKRLISYVDDACSGAYWLAATAPEIYGGTSCMVGSISAVCAIEDLSAMYAEHGVKVEVFADGDLKGAGIEGTSLSEAQRIDIQRRIEHIGGMFKTFVSARRPSLPAEAMRGQWFYGDEGLEIGLIDAHAPTLEHVVAMALS